MQKWLFYNLNHFYIIVFVWYTLSAVWQSLLHFKAMVLDQKNMGICAAVWKWHRPPQHQAETLMQSWQVWFSYWYRKLPKTWVICHCVECIKDCLIAERVYHTCNWKYHIENFLKHDETTFINIQIIAWKLLIWGVIWNSETNPYQLFNLFFAKA